MKRQFLVQLETHAPRAYVPQRKLAYSFLPYGIDHIKGNRWLLFNRFYTPLGIQGKPWVFYKEDRSVITFKRKPTEARLLSFAMRRREWTSPDAPAVHRDEETGQIIRVYLGVPEDTGYYKRLEKLMRIRVVEPDYSSLDIEVDMAPPMRNESEPGGFEDVGLSAGR